MGVASLQPGMMQPTTITSQQQAPAMATIAASSTQPQFQPPIVSTQSQQIVPPPPLAPAPTMLASPKAHSIPLLPASVALAPTAPAAAPAAMPESDFKVLLDLAVSSGNQQAVDALLRQAQPGGMSLDHFRSMLPTTTAKSSG